MSFRIANLKQVVARVEVPDIDAALPLYVRLAGVSEKSVTRVARRGIDVAFVGQFVLLAGPADALDNFRRVATLVVDDICWAAEQVHAAGGTLLEGPAESPGGLRLIARHPDGGVFEYLQTRQ